MSDDVVRPRTSQGGSVVSLREVGMSFGGRSVLEGVSLELAPGRVVALLGANGAGKSTLIKVLSGAYPGHRGRVLVDGGEVGLRTPVAARRLGIQTVHQHVAESVVPGLSVAENLVFEQLIAERGNPLLDNRRILARAKRIQEVLDLGWDERLLRRDVAELGISDQQLLILARALATRPRLLILDEPTAALSAAESQRLFTIIERLRNDGIAILYVSHRLGEIDALADDLVVLRDGRLITRQTRPFDWDAALRAMLATSQSAVVRPDQAGSHAGAPTLATGDPAALRPDDAGPSRGAAVPVNGQSAAILPGESGTRTGALELATDPSAAIRRDENAGSAEGAPLLALRAVPLLPGRRPQDLDLRGGEVTGVVGLLGAGKTELARGLFGAEPFPDGALELDGRAYRPRHPADAIRRGVHLVPEDRHTDALVPGWSIAQNISLPFLRSLSGRTGWLGRGREAALGRRTIDELGIVARDENSLIEELSGGNQQKVVVGRWLAESPRVLMLDEPFRGVDLGARRDIGRRARALAAEGSAVLLLSADVDEVLEVADRVIVLVEGEIRLDTYDPDPDRIVSTLAAV